MERVLTMSRNEYETLLDFNKMPEIEPDFHMYSKVSHRSLFL